MFGSLCCCQYSKINATDYTGGLRKLAFRQLPLMIYNLHCCTLYLHGLISRLSDTCAADWRVWSKCGRNKVTGCWFFLHPLVSCGGLPTHFTSRAILETSVKPVCHQWGALICFFTSDNELQTHLQAATKGLICAMSSLHFKLIFKSFYWQVSFERIIRMDLCLRILYRFFKHHSIFRQEC